MDAFRRVNGANGDRRRIRKWHWTHEEDRLLTTLVNKHGPGNWDYIANHIRGRTGKSCRLRWINQLDPKVDKTPFSQEDRRRLLDLHRRYGNKWSTIMSFFPGRTDNQLKNLYHVLVGTRYMKAASGPGSCTDARREGGSIDLPQYGNVGSQVPSVCCRGKDCGSSSVYGRIEGADAANLGDSMISDANSADIECIPVAHLPHEGYKMDYQFIDFMGVGRSD